MPLARFNYGTPDRGMSSKPDFLRAKGFVRDSLNCRFMPGVGVISRNGSDLIHNITELEDGQDYLFESIGDHLVVIGGEEYTGGPLALQVFNAAGAPVTIYRQATLRFENGGTTEITIDMEIEGGTSNANARVTGVTLETGSWAGGDAAGVLTIRHRTDADWEAGEDIRRFGLLTKLAEVDSTTGTTQEEVSNDYLGTDISKIRMFAIEDSIFVWNIDQVVDTLDAASDSVEKELLDYDKLINRQSTVTGQIYRTLQTALGNPAGYYLTTSGSGTGSPPDPLGHYRRIPKPGQEDAYYDPSTMPHRLLRISDTLYEWQELPWEPRLSAGDVDATDEQGLPVIRNPAVLQGQKIIALTLWNARLCLGLDNKKIVLSVARDFYNLWIDDVLDIKPSDRIVDELIEQDSGPYQYFAPVRDGIFIQCANCPAQFSARGGGALTAGGADAPYNGTISAIGRFNADANVAPVSWGSFVAMMDAQRGLHIFEGVISQNSFGFMPRGQLSYPVHEDFIKVDPTYMRVVNSSLYILTADGFAWFVQVWGQLRSGQLDATWTKTEFDEPIEFLWGDDQYTRILTTYGGNYSLLTHIDNETVPDDRFEIVPRLDRIEEVEGLYDATEHETAFVLQTVPDVDDTRMFLLYDLAQIDFIGGVTEMVVGDIITGLSSGATGTVYRISYGGEWGRTALIGAHGVAFDATVPNSAGLEAARSVVFASQIDGADEGITDSKFDEFNNASNGPIALTYSIRWVDSTSTKQDDPPDILSSTYTTVRDKITTILNQTEAQVCIAAGRLTIQFFNEVAGGPGLFNSYERQARGLALATDLRAHLIANVTNGSSIKFCGAALTGSSIIDPDATAEGDVQVFRQTIMREWVDWCAEYDAFVDIHLNCSGLETGEQPLRQQLDALVAYANEIGWTLKWVSNEFGPAHFRVGGQIPTTTEQLALAEAEERSMWLYAFSRGPAALMRAPFFEQEVNGPSFVWCSILTDDFITEKEPFATILQDQLALPTADESAYGRIHVTRTDQTRFEPGETMLLADGSQGAFVGGSKRIGSRGDQVNPTRVDGNTVYFKGDYGPKSADAASADVKHMLGRIVQARVEMLSFWGGPSRDRIAISSISTFHDRTTDYEIVIGRRGFDNEARYAFTSKVIGSMKHGETPVDTGHYEVLAGADGRTMVLSYESNTPGTFRISEIEFEYERLRV